MAVNREETLKAAEKLLKQGKMAAAIEEYVRLVEDNPEDWNTANTLGDLYVKAGQPDRALSMLESLLKTPGSEITAGPLRLDPTFAPLRSNPKFQLCASM